MKRTTLVALAALLPLFGACTTDNSPSRSEDAGLSFTIADEGEDDDGPRGVPAVPGPITAGDDDDATEDPDAGVVDAGSPGTSDVPDAAPLPGDAGPCHCPDTLEPIDMLLCQQMCLYATYCVEQPDDVMLNRGPGDVIAAGPSVAATASRPQLTQSEAEGLYTIRSTLANGGVYLASYSGEVGVGAMVMGALDGGTSTVSDAGVDASTGLDPLPMPDGGLGAPDAGPVVPLGERSIYYTSADGWYPLSEVEDVDKINPGFIVAPQGGGTHTTIQSAINDAVNVAECPRIFIKIEPGTYREKIIVPAKTSSPPITLYTTQSDAGLTRIVWGDSTAGAQVDGTPLSVHQSATFSQSLPSGFQARNLTIENDYVEGTYEADDQGAAALMNQGDRALYDNVRFLGHRNTLYVKSTAANEVARSYFRNCYIEGDEDYLLGRGTAVFDQCEFHSRGDRVSTGAVTAASTREDNPHGFLIVNSQFSADAIVWDVYLGRQWFEGEQEQAVGKVVIRNSILGAHIRRSAPWASVERETLRAPTGTDTVLYTSSDYYPVGGGITPVETYLAEFGNSGPGAAP